MRFIEAFVDELNLTALGFAGTVPKATGRPGYAPADMLKLYIYGYLNRVRSSRRLEAETHRNIEVIWLLRHLSRLSRQSPTSSATTMAPACRIGARLAKPYGRFQPRKSGWL